MKDLVSSCVGPLLTDLYQLSMAYAYWKAEKHDHHAVFDLFFRKNPFKGEFTVFAGLEESLKYVEKFKFSDDDLQFLRKLKPAWEVEFFEYLKGLDTSQVVIYAVKEGSVVFPRIPLIRVEGPLAICQMLETTLLNLVNYACLVATNAARHRLVAGDKFLLEFGLRRAQGPDGAMSASRYAYLGGFDGTSNVQAAKLFGIPCSGTHAHAFVSSFIDLTDLKSTKIKNVSGVEVEFVGQVQRNLQKLFPESKTNEGELAAFISYAQSSPSGFLALVDTYDVLNSGIPNFLAVAVTLQLVGGYKPVGIRLDSGDLAYQSKFAREHFEKASQMFGISITDMNIVASNDISESALIALNEAGHSINTFGIGTNLVTCLSQPALGGVYKLVEIDGNPRIKLSAELSKVTIPGRKAAYRLYSKDGPAMDLLQPADASAPIPGERILCRHPFNNLKRAYIRPSKVEPLFNLVWNGKLSFELPTLEENRRFCIEQLSQLREDHKRVVNPTPYKVSVSEDLFKYMHDLWENECPIHEIE